MCLSGESEDENPASGVCRGEPRAGTTHFYRGATLYILHQRCRLTLAVTFVHPDDDLVQVLQRLFSTVRQRGLRLARLYADKGFCSIPVLRYLRRQPNLSVIVAAPIKGKQDGRGLRALCRGRHSYRTTHTFASAENGELTVPLAIVRAYPQRRDGSRTAT